MACSLAKQVIEADGACLDAHVAEEELNLEFQVELELVLGVDFCHQRQNALHPRIGRLEHLAVLAWLQHLQRVGLHTSAPLSGIAWKPNEIVGYLLKEPICMHGVCKYLRIDELTRATDGDHAQSS